MIKGVGPLATAARKAAVDGVPADGDDNAFSAAADDRRTHKGDVAVGAVMMRRLRRQWCSIFFQHSAFASDYGLRHEEVAGVGQAHVGRHAVASGKPHGITDDQL